MTFDWNRARAFLATAEEGSLSAAARALGMSQPTLGRQVAALESELGVALFERIGKSLTPTPAGLSLLEHSRKMGEAAAAMSLAASGQATEIAGTIRISASQLYAARLLPPILARLRRIAPGIEVVVIADDALSDLRRREADIAIRNARPTDPTLFARLIREETAALYATPGYLASIGTPQTSEGLHRAAFIGFEQNAPLADGLAALGLDPARLSFPLRTASSAVYLDLIRAGLGVGAIATHLAETDPDLTPAAPWLPPITFPLWLVTHRELTTSRRVRVVFDLMAEALAR